MSTMCGNSFSLLALTLSMTILIVLKVFATKHFAVSSDGTSRLQKPCGFSLMKISLPPSPSFPFVFFLHSKVFSLFSDFHFTFLYSNDNGRQENEIHIMHIGLWQIHCRYRKYLDMYTDYGIHNTYVHLYTHERKTKDRLTLGNFQLQEQVFPLKIEPARKPNTVA